MIFYRMSQLTVVGTGLVFFANSAFALDGPGVL